MTKAQAFLLSVLATAVRPGEVTPNPASLSEQEWKQAVGESLHQAVGYLFFSLCEPFRKSLPESVFSRWSRAVISILGGNRNAVAAQNELVALLEGTPCIILKGLSAAAYYPNPAYRDFGDVDFWVPAAMQEPVAARLIEAGYTCAGEDNEHHTVFQKPFCHLELHREPPGIPAGPKGERLRAYFRDLDAGAVLRDLRSDYLHATFFAPSPARHGMILLLHMQHHMLGEGLGIRHLLDWALFVAQTAGQPFWQEELLPLLEEVGLLTYAKTLTKTCALYLGSPAPAFCADAPEDLCAGVIEDLFLAGNFGKKDIGRAHSAAMLPVGAKQGKKTGIFAVFHQNIMAKHPVLKKLPVLYPVFAVWEFFGYCFGVVTGKRTRISKLKRAAKERRNLYRRLQIFQ